MIAGSLEMKITRREFLKDAGAVLASADSAVANVQRSLRGEVGTLTIGFLLAVAGYFFPAIIKEYREYRRRFQDVQLSLVEMTPPGMHPRALQSGTIDIAFTLGPCNRRMSHLYGGGGKESPGSPLTDDPFIDDPCEIVARLFSCADAAGAQIHAWEGRPECDGAILTLRFGLWAIFVTERA